jgi:hypothetical protein
MDLRDATTDRVKVRVATGQVTRPTHSVTLKLHPTLSPAAQKAYVLKDLPAGTLLSLRQYFVATQDEQLSDNLREMAFVPQMRLVRAVLILESPSAASRRHAMFHERNKQSTGGGLMTEDEKGLVQKMKQKLRDDKKKLQEVSAPIERRKQKAKGPNPLSHKKRKQMKRLMEKKRNGRDGESKIYRRKLITTIYKICSLVYSTVDSKIE